jgi:hypothetical protein
MNIDLSAVWQIVGALAAATATAGVPVLIAVLNKHLGVKAGSQAADDLDQALEHGVALVLDTVSSIAAHNETVTVPVGAFGSAAALVAKLAPAAVSYLGITPAEIESLISAKFAATAKKTVVISPAAAPSAS